MASIKCPHCGLASFSGAGICKRCKKDLAASADAGDSHHLGSAQILAPDPISESGFRFHSDRPVVAWILTCVFLFSNTGLVYTIARQSTADSARILGGVIGGLLGWPVILLIVYVLSKKLREKNSLHAVINYGLALNVMIASSIARNPSVTKVPSRLVKDSLRILSDIL